MFADFTVIDGRLNIKRAEFLKLVRPPLQARLCESYEMRGFLKRGVTISYQYRSRDGSPLEDAGNPAGDSAPAGPAMPAPVEPAVPVSEAVITPATAGVTGGAHQEQTPLNKDSSSGATLRCAGCHCRERSMGGDDRNGAQRTKPCAS